MIYAIIGFFAGTLLAYGSNKKLHFLIHQFVAARGIVSMLSHGLRMGAPRYLKTIKIYKQFLQSTEITPSGKREYNKFVDKYISAIIDRDALDLLRYLALIIKHGLLLLVPLGLFLPVWWSYLLGLTLAVAYYFPYGWRNRLRASHDYATDILFRGLVTYWNRVQGAASETDEDRHLTFRQLELSAKMHKSWRIIRRIYFVLLTLIGIALFVMGYHATNTREYGNDSSWTYVAGYVLVAILFAFAAYGVLLILYVWIQNYIAALFVYEKVEGLIERRQ